ncbi:hypothetical protein AX14_007603 [Amanita brunnescens Koide BX004]|nr:hypothetical protein AX14_007603 [Amanita brunnescens Koide BX004]
MSRRNISASTTTTLLATSVTIAPESPQIKAFVRSAMERLGLTEQEVRKRAIEAYGSVERTMKAMEIGEAKNNAAIEKACPNGYAEIQVGVTDVALLNLKTNFPTNAGVNLNREKR